MRNFDGIKFKWTFRNYQQRVLDNSKRYLNDGRINIVAAPGSGKTILGLELIIRLNEPCLILSPTTTIKYQWGERFSDSFELDNINLSEYVSYDLNKPRLITSITYQGLHSAINKINSKDDEEDYSSLDIFKIVKEKGIKTICLDEAHHLQNEWQKALEQFVKSFDKKVKIISLTATPPYDASKNEWDRYISVCGPIDEEIFVPELVKTNTLCPHQDYVYFNYPSDKEIEQFASYYKKIDESMEKVFNSKIFNNAYDRLRKLYLSNDLDRSRYEYKAILVVCKYLNINMSSKIIKYINVNINLPEYSLEYASIAINYMLEDYDFLNEHDRNTLSDILKENALLDGGRFSIKLSDKLDKTLATSINKLNSIVEISKSEVNALKDKLRMLILTDYIKKDDFKNVGSEKEFDSISIVSIFETLRRNNVGSKIGVVSGSIVVLPVSVTHNLKDKEYTYTLLNDNEYALFNFKGSNKDKVAIVSELFEKGYFNILVGTKSLLGEGWDSPCINSLILASFVGSFMLSNQMRGRAIRTYKLDKDKISNVYHLVSLEPEYDYENLRVDESTIRSSDFKSIERRFECFVGPNYKNDEIESGVDRVVNLEPPYNKKRVEELNKQTLELSSKRELVKEKWGKGLEKSDKLENVCVVSNDLIIKSRHYLKVKSIVCFSLFLILFVIILCSSTNVGFMNNYFVKALLGVIILVFILFITKDLMVYFTHRDPSKNLKRMAIALHDTLKQMKVIDRNSEVDVERKSDEETYVFLRKASVHNQNDFNDALEEFLSKADNPSYVLIMNEGYKDYYYSYAVPKVIGKNVKNVQLLRRFLLQEVGDFVYVSTRGDSGKRELDKCKKKSYISLSKGKVKARQKVI